MSDSTDLRSAAFFRVEGTLVARPRVPAAAYFSISGQAVAPRALRLGGWALAAGLSLGGPLKDRPLATRATWMGLRDMSADRLACLGEEYYEDHVLPKLKTSGLDLVREAKRQGHVIVLLSDLISDIVAPLKDHVGADHLLCNHVEMKNDRATGRLQDPVIGGHLSAQWLRKWARDAGLDLEASCGYGAAGADALLLSAVGSPCAVDPDLKLRRVARDLDWPIVQA